VYVPAAEVSERDGAFIFQGRPVNRVFGKMGKSLKNAVTPDEMCEQYGADTLRLSEMFTGPLEQSRPWETRAVVGSFRLLQRIWRNVVDEDTGALLVSDADADVETRRFVHRTIAAAREGFESLRFNTAIARITELNNHVVQMWPHGGAPREVIEPLVLLIAPLAPHAAEELWSRLGHRESLAWHPFPAADARGRRAALRTPGAQGGHRPRTSRELRRVSGVEARPRCPGARRASGGVGGHLGAPHVFISGCRGATCARSRCRRRRRGSRP
jgi:leucyl-tRNA synthetase